MKSVLTLLAVFTITAAYSQTDTAKLPTVIRLNKNDTVYVQARFPGGAPAWMKYLQGSLNVDLAGKVIKLRKGQQDSVETIVVTFLVDKEGNITEVECANLNKVNSKLAREAIRVIQEGPKWLPATINGEKVIYRQRQSISFEVTKE